MPSGEVLLAESRVAKTTIVLSSPGCPLIVAPQGMPPSTPSNPTVKSAARAGPVTSSAMAATGTNSERFIVFSLRLWINPGPRSRNGRSRPKPGPGANRPRARFPAYPERYCSKSAQAIPAGGTRISPTGGSAPPVAAQPTGCFVTGPYGQSGDLQLLVV